MAKSIFEKSQDAIINLQKAYLELRPQDKPSCFGTLKPQDGSCMDCPCGLFCLETHEQGYLKRRVYDS